VLIVDDDQMNIEVMDAMLESLDVITDTAISGNAAILLIEQRIEAFYRSEAPMYKLILLDYSMPEMDGPQVAIAIRNLFTNNPLVTEKDSPYICCCTAYGEEAFKRKALSAGMDDFLQKPITYAEL
jgi:two-component system sensor histidine kinase BarA